MKSSNYLGLLALILVMCATTACSEAEPEVVVDEPVVVEEVKPEVAPEAAPEAANDAAEEVAKPDEK